MKLDIYVRLDSGGTVEVHGEDLSAEDINEILGMLAHHEVGSLPDSQVDVNDPDEEPLSDQQRLEREFAAGFDESRPTNRTMCNFCGQWGVPVGEKVCVSCGAYQKGEQ